MLGGLLLAFGALVLALVLLTARNLRRLNQQLLDENADLALQVASAHPDPSAVPADAAD
jgi:uncharacterized membrane protein YccC